MLLVVKLWNLGEQKAVVQEPGLAVEGWGLPGQRGAVGSEEEAGQMWGPLTEQNKSFFPFSG